MPLPEPMPGATPAQFAARMAKLPPLFGGYKWVPGSPPALLQPGTYALREGYFAFAAWACYVFDGDGKLTGIKDLSRGGGTAVRDDLTGTYSVSLNTAVDVFEGKITTIHENEGKFLVTNNYTFVMKSDHELDWVWASGSHRVPKPDGTFTDFVEPYRALVTQGTLTKVPYSTGRP